jgi:hypothetical protein
MERSPSEEIQGSYLMTNWYVDNAASGTNNGTSWTNAWQSFAAVVWGGAGINAGDTLYISGGSSSKTYTASANYLLEITESGSLGSPITVKVGQTTGHNGIVILNANGYDSAIKGYYCNYLVIDGEYNGACHIKITNSVLNTNNAAIDIYDTISPIIRYVEIDTADIGIAAHAGSGGYLQYLYLHGIRGDRAISFNARNPGATSYDLTFVEDCTIQLNCSHDGTGLGPDGIQGCPGLTVRRNYFYTAEASLSVDTNHMDFVQTQAYYIKIYNNRFRDTVDSAIDRDVGSDTFAAYIWIWNNIFEQTWVSTGSPTSIRFYSGGSGDIHDFHDVGIYSNIFIDFANVGDISRIRLMTVADTVVSGNFGIKNNIFYNCRGLIESPASANAVAADYNVDYNITYNSGDIQLDGSVYTQAHPNTSAPLFVSYTELGVSNDLHHSASDTAAINTGTPLDAMFNSDKDGISRPSGSGWDVGPYEYVQSAPAVDDHSIMATEFLMYRY